MIVGLKLPAGCSRNRYRSTPLHVAVASGDLRVAEMLVANGASLEILNNQGKSPLNLSPAAVSLVSKVCADPSRTPSFGTLAHSSWSAQLCMSHCHLVAPLSWVYHPLLSSQGERAPCAPWLRTSAAFSEDGPGACLAATTHRLVLPRRLARGIGSPRVPAEPGHAHNARAQFYSKRAAKTARQPMWS